MVSRLLLLGLCAAAANAMYIPGDCPRVCPANLQGPYEYPHLIVPVDQSNPDTAYGTSYFGEVSASKSSIFNFDIPASDTFKLCSLVFLFPEQKYLQTSSYNFTGDGMITVSKLKAPASATTTYNNQPAVEKTISNVQVAPGKSNIIVPFPCAKAQTVAYKLQAAGNTNLRYFQDYNPCPIGLYIRRC